MSKPPRVVRTPGEDPAPQPAADTEQTAGAEDTGDAGTETLAEGTQVSAPEASAADQALLDEIAQLRAERDAAVARAKSAEDAAATRAAEDAAKKAATDAELSDRLTSNRPVAGLQPEQVVPSQIRRPVLTEKGWIAPVIAAKHPAER